MLAAAEQIRVAYEELEMTPEQIAKDQNLDLTAVKACLMNCSKKYRGDSKVERTLDFTDDELEIANKAIVNAAQYSEDEFLKVKAAMYIRDDKKGRKSPAKETGNIFNNIFLFNDRLQKAREAIVKQVTGGGQENVKEAINI